jgi:hypothetical protein
MPNTTTPIITHLKDSIPKSKDSWMAKMSDSQLVAVYMELKKGKNLSEVISTVQTKFGISTELPAREMMGELHRFQSRAINGVEVVDALATQGNSMAETLRVKLDQISAEIQPMERLAWLANLQTRRVEKALQIEGGVLLDSTESNIRTLNGLLDNLITKQIKLGILKQVTPGDQEFKTTVNLTDGQKTLSVVVENVIQGDEGAMAAATNKFLELIEAESLTMSSEDGEKYYVTKEEDGDSSQESDPLRVGS